MLSSLGCPDAPALAAAAREVAASRRNFPGVDRGRSACLCVLLAFFTRFLLVRCMSECGG